MIPSLIIALRETLEMAVIVGIVIGYLNKTGQRSHKKIVFLGVVLAVLASLVGAVLFNMLAGGFSGRAEEIFEGITMMVGAVLLTTMILWMIGRKNLDYELESRVDKELKQKHKLGLFFLVFISVFREGIELVLFLKTANLVSEDNNLIGAVLGIILAIILGYGLFAGLMKVNIKKFFAITSVLLILFAAGLIAHGIHEFQEAGILPAIIEHVWDVNPAVPASGDFPAWHENGWLGGILKGLFGYNGNPSLLELIGYIAYLLVIAVVWRGINRTRSDQVS